MRTLPFAAVALSFLASSTAFAGPGLDDRSGEERIDQNRNYVIHEWGTFTTIAGADGKPVEWEPFSGNTRLPSFVHLASALESGALATRGTVRMETPVLYFHASEPFRVSVRVGFPGGTITEWYPYAREQQGGIEWQGVRVTPGSKVKLPRATGESEYFAARATSASPLVVKTAEGGEEAERFLFYRGVGSPSLPITVALEGKKKDHLRVGGAVGTVIVFERQGSRLGFREGSGRIARPALAVQSTNGVEGALTAALLASGMNADEADAMLATWRTSWFEEGLRVFWFVDRAQIDAMLPLTIRPAPARIERVIVGRAEVFTPEMEIAVREGKDASAYGRFAEPLLRRVCAATPGVPACGSLAISR